MGRTVTAFGAMALAVALATTAGAATKVGGPDADRLRGTNAADRLNGRGGADLLIGRGGDDTLRGGAGRDTLRGGAGHDEFNARDGAELPSPGNDRINARDGEADLISCGAGFDVAIVDAEEDGVYDCEDVREP